MTQDTQYNEEVKKLKSDRNAHRFISGVYGVLGTSCGGLAASQVYRLTSTPGFFPPESIAHLLSMATWVGILVSGTIVSTIGCYKEIVKSHRASGKIRMLEKELVKDL